MCDVSGGGNADSCKSAAGNEAYETFMTAGRLVFSNSAVGNEVYGAIIAARKVFLVILLLEIRNRAVVSVAIDFSFRELYLI